MTADDVIASVQEALDRSGGMDIVYIHSTPYGGSVAAIVKAGTPAYEAAANAYPDEEMPPHEHIEPGMF